MTSSSQSWDNFHEFAYEAPWLRFAVPQEVSFRFSPFRVPFPRTSDLARRGLYAEQTLTSCFPKDTWVLCKLGLGLQTILTPWFRAVQPKGGDGGGRRQRSREDLVLEQAPPSPHPRPSFSSPCPTQVALGQLQLPDRTPGWSPGGEWSEGSQLGAMPVPPTMCVPTGCRLLADWEVICLISWSEGRGRRGAGKTQVFISRKTGKDGSGREEGAWAWRRKTHDVWDGHNSSVSLRRLWGEKSGQGRQALCHLGCQSGSWQEIKDPLSCLCLHH